MPTPPSIVFSEFAVSGVDPVGQRHQTTHGSYVKKIGQAAGELLNFDAVNTTFSKQTTPTKAVLFYSDAFNSANEAIFNMRFWLSDISDFVAGTFNFNGFSSGVWASGLHTNPLTDASGVFVQTALPSGQNLLRQDGWTEISGVSQDSEVSEYIYLSTTFDTDVPAGAFGGATGGFTYRVTFDYR